MPTLNHGVCPEASAEGRMEDGEAVEVFCCPFLWREAEGCEGLRFMSKFGVNHTNFVAKHATCMKLGVVVFFVGLNLEDSGTRLCGLLGM